MVKSDLVSELCAQGWIIFRSREYLPENLVFHDSYLGIDQISFTLNFSKRCSSEGPGSGARLCAPSCPFAARSSAACVFLSLTKYRGVFAVRLPSLRNTTRRVLF